MTILNNIFLFELIKDIYILILHAMMLEHSDPNMTYHCQLHIRISPK